MIFRNKKFNFFSIPTFFLSFRKEKSLHCLNEILKKQVERI